SSVSTQIDVRKGQIQRWDKEVAYTTYVLTIFDRRGYVPPESPEFTTTIGRTFYGSLDALKSFGKWLVLVIVALLPWLPVIAVVVVPSWLLLRRAARNAAARRLAQAEEMQRRRERRPPPPGRGGPPGGGKGQPPA